VARKPRNLAWLGFTKEQAELLDFLDHVGNNGWARNGQTEELMPNLLRECAVAELSLPQIKASMASIGYSKDSLHQLDRWESKRTTGKFGP
jgi:hypothetical protein